MSNSASVDEVVGSAEWHVHQTKQNLSQLEFVRVPRATHREITFLEEKSFTAEMNRVVLPFDAVTDAVAQLESPAPRFIVHSSMAASTLLARAFDLPGISMSVAEPVILNELAALQLRGVDIGRQLSTVMRLLARPFARDEAVVIKPGNTANLLMPLIAASDPQIRAVCIYAPLPDFLRSVAKKGLEGRIVYRRLYAFFSRAISLPTGFTADDIWQQTDLQIAAMTWLLQHAQMWQMLQGSQFQSIDSATFLARRRDALRLLGTHFGVRLDPDAVLSTGVFERHSKEVGRPFNTCRREAEYRRVDNAYGEEIEKVSFWLERVAEHINLPLQLPRPLLHPAL